VNGQDLAPPVSHLLVTPDIDYLGDRAIGTPPPAQSWFNVIYLREIGNALALT
jgi:hypothetical protein